MLYTQWTPIFKANPSYLNILTPTCTLHLSVLLDYALGHVDILLEKTTPGGHVDVHLVWTRHLSLLPEYFPLAAKLWFPGYQWIQELYLDNPSIEPEYTIPRYCLYRTRVNYRYLDNSSIRPEYTILKYS